MVISSEAGVPPAPSEVFRFIPPVTPMVTPSKAPGRDRTLCSPILSANASVLHTEAWALGRTGVHFTPAVTHRVVPTEARFYPILSTNPLVEPSEAPTWESIVPSGNPMILPTKSPADPSGLLATRDTEAPVEDSAVPSVTPMVLPTKAPGATYGWRATAPPPAFQASA
jgi:hypothetical protein